MGFHTGLIFIEMTKLTDGSGHITDFLSQGSQTSQRLDENDP
jgi:hypothetical protein